MIRNVFNGVLNKIVIFTIIFAVLSIVVVAVYNYMYGNLDIFKLYLSMGLVVLRVILVLSLIAVGYRAIIKEKIDSLQYIILGSLAVSIIVISLILRYLFY